MTGRPYTRADYLAIKFAFRMACEDIGPLHVIAEHTRVDPAMLSRYCSADRPEFPPVDVMMDVDALSGGNRCLRALAERTGHDVVKDEIEKITVEPIVSHIASVNKEHSEFQSRLSEIVLSGKGPTPAAAKEVISDIHELEDAIDRFEDEMRRVVAGEGDKPVLKAV